MENRNNTTDAYMSTRYRSFVNGELTNDIPGSVFIGTNYDNLTHSSFYGLRDLTMAHPFSLVRSYNRKPYGLWDKTRVTNAGKNKVIRNGSHYMVGGHIPPRPSGYIDDNALYNKALGRLHEKIRNSDLNLAIALFEAKSTKRMLDNTVKTLRKVRRLAKRSYTKAIKTNRTPSSVWLEARYGWMPLISDLHGLLTHEFVRDWLVPLSGGASQELVETSTRESNFYESIRVASTATATLKRAHKFGCLARVQSPAADLIGQLSTYNPALIAWELMPYSFVVDWFYDIGSYLELRAGAANYPHIRLFRAYHTTSEVLEVEGVVRDIYCTDNYATDWNVDGKYQYGTLSIGRELTGDGLPMPRPPSFTYDLELRNIVDGIALLKQIFR